MDAAEAPFAVASIVVGSGTVASVLYLGVGSGTVVHGVLGCDIALVASIFRTRPLFLVAMAWIHSVWVVIMDMGMLAFIYCNVGAGTVAPGVLGRDITFAV